ncbi:unnamed protein product [Prunus armeniaca]|uniref:Uncharacterized protein n=1 Tax=Prunus armeniaca TaxID=36596 RepID=A0A6J5XTT5_PRUAR|nr:unnamed protein product [Prunus armeniaca]
MLQMASVANMRGWVCNKLAGCCGDWKCGDGRIVGKAIVLVESLLGKCLLMNSPRRQ